MIRFKIPGEPKGKGRPRITMRGAHAVAYTPKDTASYENWVKCRFQMERCEKIQGADTPIAATINVVYPIPKSATKKARELMLADKVRPTKKPDCDNIVKIIFDALNGLAYDDDKQIVSLIFKKTYGDDPRVEVALEEIKQEVN